MFPHFYILVVNEDQLNMQSAEATHDWSLPRTPEQFFQESAQ